MPNLLGMSPSVSPPKKMYSGDNPDISEKSITLTPVPSVSM